MKTKYPPIIRFDEYKDLYDTVDFDSLIKKKKANKKESGEMIKLRNGILEYINKNSALFNELEVLMVKYKRLYIIENIELFVSTTLHIDNKSSNKNVYRTMKVMWPQVGREDIGVRISLGRFDTSQIGKKPTREDFNNLIKMLKEKE